MKLSPDQLERIRAAGGTEGDPAPYLHLSVVATFPEEVHIQGPRNDKWKVVFPVGRHPGQRAWYWIDDIDKAIEVATDKSKATTAKRAERTA